MLSFNHHVGLMFPEVKRGDVVNQGNRASVGYWLIYEHVVIEYD